MSSFHSAYGLGLHTNEAIPGLMPLPQAPKADLTAWLGVMPAQMRAKLGTAEAWHVSDSRDEHGEPALVVSKLEDGDYFLFCYSDGTKFILNRSGTKIWASWPESLTLEDAATYLLGPVMGFILLLRGTICLHASAVAINGQAVALVGQTGAGKSTTAAAFAELGYKILSDDVVTLSERDGAFFVQPAYPCIRLWPSSVEALYGKADALPLLTPNWDKRYLDLTDNGKRFQEEALRLAAIYVLGERGNDPRSPFETLPGKDGLVELIANTYATYLMDTAMRAHEFKVLGRLMRSVPLRRAVAHSDPTRLAAFCRSIREDFQCAQVSSLPA